MTIDTTFMSKRLETFEFLYVPFSPVTHSPYVECDEDTMEDQIYVFTGEETAKEFSGILAERKVPVRMAKLPGKAAKPFFSSLYLYGITAVMIRDEGSPVCVPLDQLAKSPDLEMMKKAKVPAANPELQLTGLYFIQELTRPVQRGTEEKKHLRELEEEMAHNLLRSRMILAFDVSAIKGKWNPADPNHRKLVRIPMIRHRNGKSYQPVFTDFSEFQKFSQNKKNEKFQVLVVPYEKLSDMLVKEAEGYLFNPAGFSLLLNREQISMMMKRYGE